MSDLKRAARSLVEVRSERFESRHGLAQSRARLDESLAKMGQAGSTVFTPTWSEQEGRAVLEARFAAPPGTQRILQGLSLGMACAVGASVWAVATQEGPLQFALPLVTVLTVLAIPFVALGLASQRDAAEARIRRAIRVALLDEPERMPAQQRWEDED